MVFGNTCKECLVMPSLSECLCCGELDLCVDKIGNNGFPDGNMCIADHPHFEVVVLFEEVLRAN